MTLRIVPLGDLIRLAQVQRAKSHSYPILSMTMRSGLVNQGEKFKKRVASLDTSTYKVVTRSQLVVGFPIDEGVLSFQNLHDEAIVSPAYEIWDLTDPSQVDSRYLESYLRSPRALAYYRAKLRGTTARRRSLPKAAFLELPVLLPDVSTQRKVSQVLDGVNVLRAKRREAIALLDDLAQSVFLGMFGDPARNPMNWGMSTIGDLLESASYGTSEKSSAEGTLPVLRMNNITPTGEIDLSDLKYMSSGIKGDRYTVRKGDILFNRTNSPDLVGKSAIYRGDATMSYAGYLVRARTNSRSDPEYVAAFLNTRYAKKTLRGMCKTIVGMANINAREMQAIKIPEPAIDLQREFACRIQVIESAKAAHRAHLLGLDALFVSLQDRAFRGKLWDESEA